MKVLSEIRDLTWFNAPNKFKTILFKFLTKIENSSERITALEKVSGGVANLSYLPTPTSGIVISDTGTDATVPLADNVNAGLLKPTKFTVLENTTNINSGDQNSIVGISGTKSQYNTAVSDGDFLFVGDITQYTDELAQDAVGTILTDTLTIGLSYDDTANTISAQVKPNSITTVELSNIINISEFVNDANFINHADLTYVPTPTNGNINSDVGTDATILAATTVNAGLLLPTEKIILSNQTGVNTGDNAVNTTSNMYADSKVLDSIADADTTHAPSRNSVFDALALKYDTSNPSNFETTSQLNVRDTNNRARVNHTGTQVLSTISDLTITSTNLNTLDDGVNSTLHFHDSDRSRTNHTGTQLAATVSNFDATVTSSTHANRVDNPHVVTKTQVGLSNVDNTSDINKPISTAQQTALNLKGDKAVGLSQFASTTSAQLLTVMSDETGTGGLVFATAPTLTNPIVGTQTANDNTTKAASTAYVDTGLALKQPKYTKMGLDFTISAIPTRVMYDYLWCSAAASSAIVTANVPWICANLVDAEKLAVYWVQQLVTFFKNLENDTQFDQVIGAIPSAGAIATKLASGSFAVVPNATTDMDNSMNAATYAAEWFELVVGANVALTEIYTMSFTFAQDTTVAVTSNPFRIIFQTVSGTVTPAFSGVAISSITAAAPKCTIRASGFTPPATAFLLCAEPICIESRR